MKKAYLSLLLALATSTLSTNAFAQFNKVSVNNAPSSMEIIQVDTTSNTTIVCLKYTSQEGVIWSNIGDKTIAKVKGDYKQYHMVNSINMPISTEAESRNMLFDRTGQVHYFALEFEKMPVGVSFDIIEDESNPRAYNFYGITCDTTSTTKPMNIGDFISSTPVKE